MTTEITTPQKSEILRLFRRVEFDRSRITLCTTRIPDCPHSSIGDSVDFWLSTLTGAAASRVITWLRKEADEFEGDE